MRARHPSGIPGRGLTAAARQRAWRVVLVVVVLSAVGLAWSGAALLVPAAPLGIVSWQLAGSAAEVADLLAAWGPEGRRAAALNLGIDLVFAPAYGALLALTAARVHARLVGDAPAGATSATGSWGGRLRLAAWAGLVAAALDLLENLLMLTVLATAPGDTLAQLTRWAAGGKFGLLAAAIGVLVAAGIAARVAGRRGP